MIYDSDFKKRWDEYSALETATRRGEERKSREVVANLISRTDFDDEKINGYLAGKKETENYFIYLAAKDVFSLGIVIRKHFYQIH